MSRGNTQCDEKVFCLRLLYLLLCSFNLSETDCYTWHDTMFVTLSRMRPTRAIPSALGSLSPEAKHSQSLRLVVLCGVEAYPEAGGLLCGQRSYVTIGANYKRALLFQDGIHAQR